MINEDAPTNSVGTGAETALPPSHEPPGIKLTRKKPKKRRFEKSVGEMLKTEELQEHAPVNYLLPSTVRRCPRLYSLRKV